MSFNRNISMNPPGFVPKYGQGLRAKESQLGAIGTKEWLKAIKLHKYWPIVSHWSYWQMMGLTEESIEDHIHQVGGTGITCGAKGKLLRSIEELRCRPAKLQYTIEDLVAGRMSLTQALSYVLRVLFTPIPTSEEESFPTVIVHTFLKVMEYTWSSGISLYEQKKVQKIISEIKANPVLRKAQVRLKDLKLQRPYPINTSDKAGTTPSLVIDALYKRRRNCSEDSGFDENPHTDYIPPSAFMLIWPDGPNTVMFGLQDYTCHSALLQHSPFYTSGPTTMRDENFKIEEHINILVDNLFMS